MTVYDQTSHALGLPDVPLADEDTGVVDALGQPQFEDLGLQTTLHEVLNFQTQHVIQLHLGLLQYTNTHQTTQQGITWSQTEQRKIIID